MAVHKLSVSLDEEAVRAARAAAEAAGMSLSAWLSRATKETARVEAGLRAVADWEAEHGAITDEDDRAAHDVLVRAALLGS